MSNHQTQLWHILVLLYKHFFHNPKFLSDESKFQDTGASLLHVIKIFSLGLQASLFPCRKGR